MDIKTFTKAQLTKQIHLLEKKINKLDISIKNNNEILEQNKKLKLELEKEVNSYKTLEKFV